MDDKEILKYLLLEDVRYKDYIFRLYKIYDLCNKVTKEDIEKNKRLLDYAEDKIYTVNGKCLSNPERIYNESIKLYKKIKKAKESDDNIDDVQEFIDVLKKYKDSFYNKDKNFNKIELETKEKISLLQAKYNLPISFLYAASRKFKEIYDAELINMFAVKEELYNRVDNTDIKKNEDVKRLMAYYNSKINNFTYVTKKKDGGNNNV
jgi:hypothetical protein